MKLLSIFRYAIRRKSLKVLRIWCQNRNLIKCIYQILAWHSWWYIYISYIYTWNLIIIIPIISCNFSCGVLENPNKLLTCHSLLLIDGELSCKIQTQGELLEYKEIWWSGNHNGDTYDLPQWRYICEKRDLLIQGRGMRTPFAKERTRRLDSKPAAYVFKDTELR